VAIPIIGHAWAKTFGTLAVAWEALTRITDVPDTVLATVATGLMLAVANLVAGFSIAWLYGRGRGVREALPAVLVIAAIHGLGQTAIALLAPNLANVVPGTVALAAILLLARRTYAQRSGVNASPLMTPSGSARISAAGTEVATNRVQPMPLWLAFAPYLLLIALIMTAELIPFVGDPLAAVRFGLPFPAFETGYGVVTEATPTYSEFSPLTHPGTFLLVSSAMAFWFFRSRGHIGAGRIDEIAIDTIKTSVPTIMALVAFIPLALVLEGSGMVLELARGIAQVASGPVYAFLSPLIGALGGFLTGSNMSANILFGPLQAQAANALGINAAFVLAAQTAGASIGASIGISSVLMGLGAVGAGGQAADAIRKTLPYAAITLTAIAVIALAGALLFPVGGTASGAGA
jgi:lactate permease